MKDQYIKIATSLLIILWIYTAGSKLIDYQDFKHQLRLQHFSSTMISILQWSIPFIEIITAALLTFLQTRRIGLYLSTILLIAFTGYITLILSGFYIKTPCSCGGVLKSMGWRTHLAFNIFFLLLNIVTVYFIHSKERRPGKGFAI
ncbi:MauE/DoxX family redox-associated membrane protein [Pedobacter sp. KLB.chiD]|uniref:MauE/DoxX family redox-associated membrane protein n=1 Tax=Pedobacter sp. KLB.chiD TaxID=3387402 RepID=UPI00399990C3